MILLLLAAGAVYLLLGDRAEALFLLASIGLVAGIELRQASRTERALEALRDLSSPRARAVRDGDAVRIPARELVRDDVVLLAEGDRVPADGVILSSTSLTVDESLLTGESAPVQKDEGAEVCSGTLAVRGTAAMRVTSTGPRTRMGRIGKALATEERERGPLQVELAALVRVAALIGLALCLAVTGLYGLLRGQWLEAMLAGLSLAISLLPEELPVILTVFMALGAWRIARSRVLTRRAPTIETLGSATVLCVDKTGTLTWNRMELRWRSGPDEAALMEAAVLAGQRDPVDPMDRAIRARADATQLHPDWELVREYPLTPSLRALTRVWRMPGGLVAATKGAPEAVIGLCGLDATRARSVLAEAEAAADRGLRVLGVARSAAAAPLPETPEGFAFEYLGLLGFEDPVRETVPGALKECAAAGIRTVMITGDHPGTARAVARSIGLPNAEEVRTGAELAALGPAELRTLAGRVNVFARVAPEQKLALVRALQAAGEVVAMTGDGVNDAPALRAAHIGIAMGSRGTDVAREAAALVLLDDDFASIVHAVRLGRRIFDNLRKAMAYVLAAHVPIAGMSLAPVLFGWPLLLYPAHIVFIEFVIDPICSIAFEGEGEERDVMSRRPRTAGEKLFPWKTWVLSLLQGAGLLGLVLAAVQGASALGRDEGDARALAFAALVVGNLALALGNRSWSRGLAASLRQPNPVLVVLMAGSLGLLTLALTVPFLVDVFRFGALGGVDAAILGLAAALTLSWGEILKRFRRA